MTSAYDTLGCNRFLADFTLNIITSKNVAAHRRNVDVLLNQHMSDFHCVHYDIFTMRNTTNKQGSERTKRFLWPLQNDIKRE